MLLPLVWPVYVFQMLGSSTLPLYELDFRNVLKRTGRLRPFVNPRGFTSDPRCLPPGNEPENLSFSSWRLAQAVKKADCLRRLPFHTLSQVGFLLEQAGTLDWRQDNLRLFNGVTQAYADFVGTGLAGRIGQGIAILLMEKKGYAFAAHYPREGDEPGPDFVFERYPGPNALVEAKGSFVEPAEQQNIKGELKEAIQTLRTATRIAHKKLCAVATYLREAGDRYVEPSLVAFVDPELRDEADQHDRDWIRRENYAAWLDAMGFLTSASDLRARIRRGPERGLEVPTLEVAGRRFILAVTSIRLKPEQLRRPFTLERWPLSDGFVFDVAGIEIGNLRLIEEALADPTGTALLQIRPWETHEMPDLERSEGFRGSTLSDGTLFGEIDAWIVPSLAREAISL